VPHAVPFDQSDGDANNMLDYFESESFDCVHSSHCLEHMRDVGKAITDWWSLIKPGGYLVTVVPDEDLYEQGIWPSRFNADHKHTFRIGGKNSWSPVSHDVYGIIAALPKAVILSTERQDEGYVHQAPISVLQLPKFIRTKVPNALNKARKIEQRIGLPVERAAIRIFCAFNCVIDQTIGNALAQIQIVAQKQS
jgi:SAM-dependent methyltransferase